MKAAPEKCSRRARLLYVASLLGAILVGWLAGHFSSPNPQDRAPAAGGAGAARSSTDEPTVFADTAAGAASAVASYERSFASPDILRAGVLRDRIEAVATPDYVAAMLAANSPGQERLASGPLGAGLASGVKTIYSAVPIGYRVESFTPQRARVLTWGFTLLGNASAVEPSAFFGLTRTEVVWEDDAWKIAETKAGFGPTPKLATPPGPLGGYNVINIASQLRSYELAP
jgi:hypothetical protein